ncbi:putative oxidoreductase [Cocos nucifera]|uniref:Putative oxidoreductase n=1 Tax=Cocos nucifera TaxID=13894 RepID=A0A8K0MYG8_COCNU|nr:putative oxidoreductase [Cocos nucifera]
MADKANPIRFGILGCATIARKVYRAIALAPNATVVAVCSRSLDKAQRFIADNGLPPTTRAYGSYEAALDDPAVDAVYLPLPTSLHVRWAVAAAEHGKHVLLEKPTALCAADLDRILEACGSQGVQFMDSTMWMHHPRTARMRELLSDPHRFGQLKAIHSIFTFCGDPDFLQNDIRVKPDLDALGALGDLGWYCIRSVLWAADYELPGTAIAHHGCMKNQAGVILSCGATLVWDDGKVATFYCSFFSNLTMELSVLGTRGTLHLSDFVIPFEETPVQFKFATDSKFKELHTGWQPLPSEHVISTDLPQEALMIQEFSRLAGSIIDSGSKPDEKWPTIARKTQLVLDAVKESIEKGFEPVNVTG